MRARAAAAGNGGGEVAVRQPLEVAPVRVQIERMEAEFRRAMPAGEAVQFVRDALTCIQTIKNLDRCEPRSLLGSLMTCAQLGLRPAVLGHAWPLPFWDRGLRGYKAQLIIGYQGYTHLAYESGKVAVVKASTVYEEDFFEWDEGSNEPPEHRRPKLGRPRGDVIGYYSVVQTVMGGTLVHVMDVPEMRQFRDAFAPRGKPDPETGVGKILGPWASEPGEANFDGMAKKTTLRYALKTAPKSAQLARAESVDGTVRIDTSVVSEPAAVSAHPAAVEASQPESPGGDVPDPHDGNDPWATDGGADRG